MVFMGFIIPWWFYPLFVWTLVWKGLALWKAGRNNQTAWFVVILILNTAGVLPIIYLIWFQRNLNFTKAVSRAVNKIKKRTSNIEKKVKKAVRKKK